VHQRIVAYNTKNRESKELASTDYFTDVMLLSDKVYYVIAASDGSQSKGLTVVNVDGSNKKVVLAKTIWTLYKTDAGTLVISADGNEWYQYVASSGAVDKLEGAPASLQSISFVVSEDGKRVAWVETRDGKQVVLIKNLQGENTQPVEVVRQSGITYPLRWLTDKTLLYAVGNAQESAHYVISTAGGEAKKIGDVTISVYGDTMYY
jgi:hypothetical protein